MRTENFVRWKQEVENIRAPELLFRKTYEAGEQSFFYIRIRGDSTRLPGLQKMYVKTAQEAG